MFAKRQSALAASAGLPPASRGLKVDLAGVVGLLKKPPVALGVAAVLMMGAATLFVTVLGDPRAGLPSERVALKRDPVVAAQEPTGAEVFTLDTLGLYQDLTAPGFEGIDGPQAGEAVITLPDGARASAGGGPTFTAPVRAPRDPLPAAPRAGLSPPGPTGPLPVIATDGRAAAQAYARPFRPNGKPRAALVIGGLGMNAVTTRAAIERLPGEITLSFVPYAEGLQGWIDLARAHGHEVLIEIPMEPAGYPDNDPGPYTLLSSAGPDDITNRMEWLLGRASGYFGVTNYLGDRFVGSDTGMTAFMGVLRQRGLAFVDDGSARRRQGAWARASADRIIDETRTSAAIVAQLNALEQSARSGGQALGSGLSYPVTVEAVARWASELDKRGIQLAPASAVTRRPGR